MNSCTPPPRGRSARCTRGGVLCHIQVVKEHTKTKSPGALRRTRALEDRERIESLDDLLHPERARIGLAWRDRLQLPRFPSVYSCHVVKVSCHSWFPPTPLLPSALTRRKQKARSACAVRAPDGRNAATRLSSPRARHSKLALVASRSLARARIFYHREAKVKSRVSSPP